MEALEVNRLTKYYGTHKALDQVSLSVPQGGIYGLLGPNGAGKTTLIRIVNQMIKPDSGEIFLFGEKLKPEHTCQIGYLPEERGLYKKMKLGEQLLYFAQLKGLSRAEAVRQCKIWFERMEIGDWWGKKVEDLSKGMAQKAQFICTVLHNPKLIILDEPFSGFDPINVQLITEYILELKKKGAAIIFSTHRMETVESLCDKIALINASQKIIEGSKEEIKEQFATNVFTVRHQGALRLPLGFVALQEDAVGDLTESVLKTPPMNANECVRALMVDNEIHSFQEKKPTMSDIFIRLVTQGTAGPVNELKRSIS